MVKFAGCILIVLACSGLGYMMGIKYKMRVAELRSIKMCLQMLETEIVYANTPLPEAFNMVYSKSSVPVNSIFKFLECSLSKKNHDTVGEAFTAALQHTKDKLSINKDDRDILISFGSSLGSSDIDGQIKNFAMAIKQLESQEKKAEELRQKNERMFKNLGVLAGLAIAIIML